MDVLHEITRSNGRQVILLQHEHSNVGKERDLFYVRGYNYGNPGECVSVFLTADEVDRLTATRAGQLTRIQEDAATVDSIFSALRSLSFLPPRRR